MIASGKNSHKYFSNISDTENLDKPTSNCSIKTVEAYCNENSIPLIASKRYFRGNTLEEIISNYPFPKMMQTKERKRGNIILFRMPF
jgi:dual specificity protein kinase YAK1